MTSFEWVGSLDAWLPNQRGVEDNARHFVILTKDSFRGTSAKPVPIPKRSAKDSTQSSSEYFRSMSTRAVTSSLLSFFGAETSKISKMCPAPTTSEQHSCDSAAHSSCDEEEEDDDDDVLALASSLSPSDVKCCLLDWRPCPDGACPAVSSDCCPQVPASTMRCAGGALSQLLAQSPSTSAPAHSDPSLGSAASLPLQRSVASISLASLCTALSSPFAKGASLAAAPTEPAGDPQPHRQAAADAATVALATNAFERSMLPLSQLRPIACTSWRPMHGVLATPDRSLDASAPNQRNRCIAACQPSTGVPNHPWAMPIPISSGRPPVAVSDQDRSTEPWHQQAIPMSRSYVV